jgi:surface polysaccharide O-acyltransferase-like enzyme
MKQGRNLWLDLFKLCMCWMIISIHFAWDTYWYHPIYRLAVPLFFAISGYFNYRKDTEKAKAGAVNFIKRSFRYLLVGFAFYIVFDFIMCYVDSNGVGYYFTTLFYEKPLFEFVFQNRPITYSGAQLWFLIALFMVAIVHYALLKFGKEKWYRYIVPATLLIQLFFGGYMRIFQETDMPIRFTRNAWFMGLPFFGMGYLLAQYDLHKKRWYKWIYLLLGIVFFLLQIPEHSIVQTEVYASTVPATAFILLFFLDLPSPRADFYYKWFGKSMSFYVYILHMAVGIVLGKLFTFQNLFFRSIAILLLSIGVYEACYLAGMWIRHTKRKDTPNAEI